MCKNHVRPVSCAFSNTWNFCGVKKASPRQPPESVARGAGDAYHRFDETEGGSGTVEWGRPKILVSSYDQSRICAICFKIFERLPTEQLFVTSKLVYIPKIVFVVTVPANREFALPVFFPFTVSVFYIPYIKYLSAFRRFKLRCLMLEIFKYRSSVLDQTHECLTALYVVGYDGGKSFTRRKLPIPLAGDATELSCYIMGNAYTQLDIPT
ncbi:LOW QUALITY PROTEIN: hypothetical protein BC937DRAFT_90851 [Endogone sp. FLAS-F59071]|nr:LOW QUALITY PROTEIN: hypothetical protein BC937DRAFT_90851 [Endogone sp. FLAS-F59071]|eukprot:RUS16747.1 LOW QUALITY PROTEIN: hypothetical protein BC937DRAFT_90851 [Endogone sp. FLAS-F59071]